MSGRNSRNAKDAKHAAEADRYPRMPEGACFGSSRFLAACYPELRYAEGWWSVNIYADGREIPGGPVLIEHAWNVVTATGLIVDSTLTPALGRAVRRGDAKVRYREEPLSRPADSPELWTQVTDAEVERAASMTAGMNRPAKRRVLEQLGYELVGLIEKHERRPYKQFDDVGVRYVQELIRGNVRPGDLDLDAYRLRPVRRALRRAS